jgi:hypothetical protein
MTDYKHRCLECGSPCGYTGILNSADCSNPSCKFAKQKITPTTVNIAPSSPVNAHCPKCNGGVASNSNGDAHCFTCGWNTFAAQKPTKLTGALQLMVDQATVLSFFRWVAGEDSNYFGGDVNLGLWDEGYMGYAPKMGSDIKDCVSLWTVPCGAAGWEENLSGGTWSIQNRHKLVFGVSKHQEISHLVLGDTRTVFFVVHQNFANFGTSFSFKGHLYPGQTLTLHPKGLDIRP